MKISKILVAGLASTCLTVSAMAEVANPVNTATPSTKAVVFNNHLNTADLNHAFGGNQDLQVQAMTSQEMDETQGAVVPVVVYGLLATSGRIAYVGITKNLARRTAQHAATKSFSGVKVLGSIPTRTGARIIEQNNINKYNTINNGWNKINSISPKNPLSKQVTVPYKNRNTK